MIVLVTGATAGFGAAMARVFVKNGHKVIAAGRRAERLEALAAELGPNCCRSSSTLPTKARSTPPWPPCPPTGKKSTSWLITPASPSASKAPTKPTWKTGKP